MSNQALAALQRDLQSIADRSTNEPLSRFDAGITWTRGDALLTVKDDVASDWYALVGDLSKRPIWSERVSETFIRDKLVPVLFAARDAGHDEARRVLKEFVALVENYTTERTTFIPVGPIILDVDEVQIGQITLRNVDEAVVDEFVAMAVQAFGYDSDCETHTVNIDDLHKKFQNDWGGKVCAEYRALGEPTRVQERGLAEARRALELITCANAAMYAGHRQQSDAIATLEGEVPSFGPVILTIAPGSAVSFHSSPPKSWPIKLTPAVLERYERTGFWILSDLLKRPARELTKFEDALVRGAHWIAISQTQAELETRLLNLMTAIESLVGPQDGDPIRTAIAEGTALIIANDFQSRLSIKQFINGAYVARSRLSHGGSNPVTDSDVRRLRGIALSLLATLVSWNDGLPSKKHLLDWLEQARLTGERLNPPTLPSAPKTLRALREAQYWSFDDVARRIRRDWIDADVIEHFERRPPDVPELKLLAEVYGIKSDQIALLKNQMWLMVRGHLFHLTANRNRPGSWTARVTGWDYSEATEWPCRPLDPAYPDLDSPTVTFDWRESGFTAAQALACLSERIRVAMEKVLTREPLQDDPEDWTPPELPRHWQDHLKHMKKEKNRR